jgi:excisionase family DNA binding protein
VAKTWNLNFTVIFFWGDMGKNCTKEQFYKWLLRAKIERVKDNIGEQTWFLEELMEYEILLNAGQVARMLGLSVATIRKWVLTRYIPYRKMGRAVRFSAMEIQEWMKDRCVEPLENKQGCFVASEAYGGEK